MPYDAREVANFFLDYADEKGRQLTIMALIKLIYFAHGWCLAKKAAPLIKNGFEAWKYGPVVRVLYEQFQMFKDKPITRRATKLDPVTREISVMSRDFDQECASFLIGIFEEYTRYHAYDLSNMTHSPGSPWDIAWNVHGQEVNPGMRISDDDIAQHFSKMAALRTRH